MNNNTDLNVFSFQDLPVRTVIVNDEIWFIPSDACAILGIINVSDAVAKLDDDEKLISLLTISGQGRNTLLINESGLYHLIFTSRKEEAKIFRKWVTSEVIPSIRKTGSYSTPQQRDDVGITDAILPNPPSYEQLQRVKRWVNATEALYYPDRTVKKFAKEEKQAQRLISEVQLSEELLEAAIIHKMMDLKEKGTDSVTSAVMYAYLKKSTREEIERRMKSLIKLGRLQGERTKRALRFKITA